jgi:sirohydrochlorin cobaltochelatase
VIVVPFFIADGLHSFEDIPVLLGLTHKISEQGFTNPHRERDRRLWYAGAIGTEEFLADVIIAQVERAAQQHSASTPGGSQPIPALEDAWARFLKQAPPPWKIGQIIIHGDFELRHEDDAGVEPGALQPLVTLQDLRAWVRLDAEGRFRPLRAAPNLRRGWIYHANNVAGLRVALDYFYPAELANWQWWQEERLPITPWRETAERQSGRFRVVREIVANGMLELAATYCEQGCLKTRLWSPANESVDWAESKLPLLCPEACNYLVAKAREKLKGAGEE